MRSSSLVFTGLCGLLVACTGSGPVPPNDGGAGGGGGGVSDGGGGTGGGSSDAGLALKSACTVLNSRRCEYLSRCALISATVPAVRDCLAWLQATSCGPTKWQARVEPPLGTLRYDPLAAQLCAEGWASRACSDYGTEPSACNRFLLPNAFNAQACYDGYLECTESNQACRGAACPRSCQPLGASGEVCRDTVDCKKGLYCRLTNPATGVGACTSPGLLNALCDVDQPCGAALVCSGGKCASPPVSGQPCLGATCDVLSWCHSTPDGGACEDRKDAGVSCTDDVQCQSSLLCEVLSNQCVRQQLTQTGAPCGLRQSCPIATVCLGATATALGQCQAPRPAGESCVSSNDCQSHLACVSLDGGLVLGCGPRQLAGQRCTEDRDCQLLSVCRQQTCARLPATGESCAATQACVFGPCVSSDAGTICSEPFGPGALCAKDSDCSSARCVTGKCLPSCTP